MGVSVVIPTYNEKGRLEKVLGGLKAYDEVIIVDDNSTKPVASYILKEHYPNVVIIKNDINKGYIFSIKSGIQCATHDIIVTMDADGEHSAGDIQKLIEPIERGQCDIVFGKRPQIARPSERFLLWMAKVITGEKVVDAGTGFRAIRSTYAKRLHFYGSCTCGTLLQECYELDMKICEVPVSLPTVGKPRKIAWNHFMQFFTVIKFYFKSKEKK